MLTERLRQNPHALLKLGFWFFLIKGLLWLALPVLTIWLGWH